MIEQLYENALDTKNQVSIFILIMVVYGLLEFIYLLLARKSYRNREYGQLALNFVISIGLIVTLGRFVGVLVFANWGSQYAPFISGLTWYWFIYAFLIYEFWYWIQHYMGHKVRLFWCIHSTHHAPKSMSMMVGFEHNFLEALIYFPFFFGFLPALFGVNPVFLVIINMIDVVWGSFLHINNDILKNGRYGFLGRFLQTPSHHRAHHGQNIKYMDTNFNSITLFWDWVFGTVQPLDDKEPVKYGITREVDTGNIIDMQYGDFKLLFRDVYHAPGLKNKLLYLIMPPGWSHTGDKSQLVSELKKQLS